jgi:hypothetical protein
MVEDDNEWQLEADVRTLSEAMEIVKDAKRLKAAQDFAKKKKADLEKIEDVSYLEKIGLK